MSLSPTVAGTGVAVYVAMLLGLAFFIALEVRKWRRLGVFLTRRQVVYRVATFVLLGLLMVDLGLLFFLRGGPETLGTRVALLWVLGGLLPPLVVLTVLDVREIQIAHYRREMEFYGELAKALVGGKKKKPEAEGEPDEAPDPP
jgi:hypothetical protein